MQYQLAPLYCRPWTLNGITPRLIESHYETNYGDALRRLERGHARARDCRPGADAGRDHQPAETR